MKSRSGYASRPSVFPLLRRDKTGDKVGRLRKGGPTLVFPMPMCGMHTPPIAPTPFAPVQKIRVPSRPLRFHLIRMHAQTGLELRNETHHFELMSVKELVMQLPRREKLQLMESLWIDLNQVGEEIDSPAWHEVLLQETDRRLTAGEEEVFDWEDAKRRILGSR